MSPGRGGRAFTLVELLVAIVLVIVIGAIALPVAMGFGARAVFGEACERVRIAGALARSEAIRRGFVVEAVAEEFRGGWRIVAVEARGESGDDAAGTAWREVLAELPAGCSVVIAGSGQGATDDPEAGTVLIARIRPGGAAAGMPGVRIAGPSGLWAGLTVNGWTGVFEVGAIKSGVEGDAPDRELAEAAGVAVADGLIK